MGSRAEGWSVDAACEGGLEGEGQLNNTMSAIETLLSYGWRECANPFNRFARCFYKQHDTPTRCCGNDDKEGIQVCIAVYEGSAEMPEGYEVEIAGGLKDGTWISLTQWALRNEIASALSIIPRLLSTWEHIANSK
jgi:hypothetical protein